jgi:hypothetical protein
VAEWWRKPGGCLAHIRGNPRSSQEPEKNGRQTRRHALLERFGESVQRRPDVAARGRGARPRGNSEQTPHATDRSGGDWRKVKTMAWREANRGVIVRARLVGRTCAALHGHRLKSASLQRRNVGTFLVGNR